MDLILEADSRGSLSIFCVVEKKEKYTQKEKQGNELKVEVKIEEKEIRWCVRKRITREGESRRNAERKGKV